MPTPLQSCTAIAGALAAAHVAHPESPQLDALHSLLDDGLEEHADLLGLDQSDRDEIRGVTLAARGGEPKPR